MMVPKMEVNAKRMRRKMLSLTEQRRCQRAAIGVDSLFAFLTFPSNFSDAKSHNCVNSLTYSAFQCQGKRGNMLGTDPEGSLHRFNHGVGKIHPL